ncbi:hypothetical protein C9890_0128 [Perkinsus sp. BL_2016]|nr:hypothetical protein C9890_0128 [Perkinsus sp. BL_2016]
MSITLAGSQEASVVVFKNLPVESTVEDIEELIASIHMISTGIDRKVDSLGQFRGTAFVRFATPEIAVICIDKLQSVDSRINGKKVKVELLRQPQRGRSYSAKEVLEGGEDIDQKASRVRDLITAFVHSDRLETSLPTDFDSDQRKLAHSLAEKFGLTHTTVNPTGESLDASPRFGDRGDSGLRTVHIAKKREEKSGTRSFVLKSGDNTHAVASFVAAAATNDLHKIQPLLPEVPVYAAKAANNLDQIAMMHAAQAQVHAAAAKAALEAAKRSKERDAMPDWLEIVDQKVPVRLRSKSNLNPNAPEFIPSSSFMGEEEIPEAPPGLE